MATTARQLPPAVLAAGAKRGFSQEELAAGHRILVTQCTTCHGVQPLERYSAGEWRDILVEMSRRARLDAGQKAQLSAYVLAAREATP